MVLYFYTRTSVGGWKMNIKKVVKNVTFVKSGSGHLTPRITIPIEWAREMELSENEKEVELTFDSETKELAVKKVTK